MQLTAILTLIALIAALAAPAGVHSQSRGDEVVLEMNQAFKKADRKRLAALLPQASGHVLEPWAAYWELRARLDAATPAEVQSFFSRFAGTYQEDRLRNDWLLMLGARRDWTNYAAEHLNFRMNDDRELRCYSMSVENAFAGIDVAAELKRNWYGLKDADDGCNYLAAKLHAVKKISDADVWRKARLAMEANRPKAARLAAEIVVPDAAIHITEIQDHTARYLSKRVVAVSKVNKEWIVLALTRLATSDPDAAATALDSHWSVHLTPEQRSWAWGVIGKSAAQRLSPEAFTYFDKARNSDLNDDLLSWKVRTALRKSSWKDVLAATKAMDEDTALEPTWVYWRARAQLILAKSDQDRSDAASAFQSIAGPRGFYEQLALEETGQRISVAPRPAPLTAEEKDAARKNQGLHRGLYAIQMGLRSEGVREWNYSTNLHAKGGMADRELLAAADLACQREVWDRCINTSERTRGVADFDQRFPMPFKESVVARARQIDLDPAYVYGLIRQESRFIMDARSGVGASGLMQVMPATAKWTAKKIGLTDFQPQQITDRDTNIAIGTGYLKLVLDDFAGSMPLAAAAYNAGPGRPRSWRGATGGPVLEAAIWAENIPFAETRDYVKKVLANTTTYAAIITGQPQSLKARLGRVGPRDGAAPDVNRDLP